MTVTRRSDAFLAFTRISFTLFVLIIGLHAALRLWNLSAFEPWFDEVFSINVVRGGWAEIVPAVARDVVHPPLFYLLLKLWVGVGGESLFWMRLFPALSSVAAVVPFFLLCRELKLRPPEINTALMLTAVNSYLIYYAQEIRMYGLLLFLTLTSLWLFARIINGEDNSKSRLAWLFVVNLLLIYTQYFGWLVVGVQIVYVLAWKRRLLFSFAVSVLALALCFAPWARLVLQAAAEKKGLGENLAWLEAPYLSELVWYYATLHGTFAARRTTAFGLILFLTPLLFWFGRVLKLKAGEDETRSVALRLLFLFSFLPPVVAFAASQVLPHSIWNNRYLIISAVPYLTLVASATRFLPGSRSRILVTSLILGWASLSTALTFARDNRKIRWNELAVTVTRAESARSENVKIYTFEEWVAAPLRFSLEPSGGVQKFDVAVIKDISVINQAHFWVVFRADTWQKPDSPQKIFTDAGCRLTHEMSASDESQKVTVFSADCER